VIARRADRIMLRRAVGKTAYEKHMLMKGSCRLRFDIGFEQRY
jgi:hypothetical protein